MAFRDEGEVLHELQISLSGYVLSLEENGKLIADEIVNGYTERLTELRNMRLSLIAKRNETLDFMADIWSKLV